MFHPHFWLRLDVTAALAVLLAAAGWLAFVGLVCLFRPQVAQATLGRMGSTWRIQLGEHALRGLAGLAMVLRADASKVPELFTFGGWFVVASSVLIVLAPRRWHHDLSLWFAAMIPTAAWPPIGIVSLLLAGLLGWASL